MCILNLVNIKQTICGCNIIIVFHKAIIIWWLLIKLMKVARGAFENSAFLAKLKFVVFLLFPKFLTIPYKKREPRIIFLLLLDKLPSLPRNKQRSSKNAWIEMKDFLKKSLYFSAILLTIPILFSDVTKEYLQTIDDVEINSLKPHSFKSHET